MFGLELYIVISFLFPDENNKIGSGAYWLAMRKLGWLIGIFFYRNYYVVKGKFMLGYFLYCIYLSNITKATTNNKVKQ